MCKEETIRGLDSGKLIAVPKWQYWIKNAGITFILTIVFYTGVKVTAMDNRVFKDAKERENFMHMVTDNQEHTINKTVHMPLIQKMNFFVPRTELQIILGNIETNQEKIMKKLNIN